MSAFNASIWQPLALATTASGRTVASTTAHPKGRPVSYTLTVRVKLNSSSASWIDCFSCDAGFAMTGREARLFQATSLCCGPLAAMSFASAVTSSTPLLVPCVAAASRFK